MANTCDTNIAHDFIYDCENPPAAGLENEALLINWDDIDRAQCAFNETQPNVLETLVLKSGKKANIVQQRKTSFNGTAIAQVEGTYSTGTTQTFAFAVFENSADAKANIEKMLNGKFIAIVQNSSGAEDARYEILGWYTGLKTPTLSKDYVAEESAGVYAITLASGNEPGLPVSFFDTDLDTTATAYEALKTAAS